MMRVAAWAVLTLAMSIPAAAGAQETRAERSGFRETSTHADVLAFLDSLEARGASVRHWTLTRSPEGREVPIVLAARPMVSGAEMAHASGKPIVYVQANIHAGEVEGKEAAQMLLRDLTLGPLRSLLDSVIVLVVPIYNADGNEAWATGAVNRPGQNGPETVGRRANGQGLDLNRDYVKLEAPETRASMELITRWDPDLFVDLHTSNGSYHGYALTFSPGLNPNHSPVSSYTQDDFLPALRERMRKRYRLETFPYGNFRNQEPDSLTQGWETYDGRARYGTNWHALRNRMSILSEAYSNDPFERRVRSTYAFVREILSLAAERQGELHALIRRPWRPDSVALQQRFAQPRMERVIAELTSAAGDGSHGFARRTRSGEFRTIRMPVWDRFASKKTVPMPSGYLVPDRLQNVVGLLRRHGIAVTPLDSGWQAPTQLFVVSATDRASRAFEGHEIRSVEGRWQEGPASATGRWWLVPTAQQDGVLAAFLLEPESEDGVVAWNFVDEELRVGGDYPILRVQGSLASFSTRPVDPR